jgi:hypothetical protein
VEAVIEKVYWGSAKAGETVFLKEGIEMVPGRYLYEPGQSVIINFGNASDTQVLSETGETITVPAHSCSTQFYLEEYNGRKYALDYFKEDLGYELYDRGLIKNNGDVIKLTYCMPYVTIVKMDVIEQFFTLHKQYQTGKWKKTYSWAMENGPAKDAAYAEEQGKLEKQQ